MPMQRLAFAIPFLLAPLVAQTRNVLMVVADDVGVDSVGCYGLGSNPPPTPTIDALAATGVRFTNAQACPLCSPTRASLLTGRHGFRTGVGTALGGASPGLAASEVLLPEALAPAGIQTALIGKWHCGNDLGPLTPTAEGFGTFTGAIGGALPSYYQWQKVENGVASQSTTYATTDTADEAIAFVQGATQPWFLLLSFNAGHTPYEAPPAGLHTQNLAGLDPQTTPVPFYKAMVQAMDSELNRFLQTLSPATRANTNIVFLGDNGTAPCVVQAPYDPQRSKGTVYQGGVRVPLIVNGPAVIGAPRVEPSLVHAVDLFATLAAMQGVDANAAVPAGVPVDAVDFGPLLAAAGSAPVRTVSYSQEFAGSTAMAANGDSEMIRDAQYSLLRFVRPNLTVREELYDLAADPLENVDLLLAPLSPAASAARLNLGRELARLRGYAFTSSYGASCSGAGVTPTLAVAVGSTPTVGRNFTLRVQGLTGSVLLTVGAVGFQNTSWNGLPLPVDLGVLGMTSCSLWTDLTITQVLPQTAMAATMVLALPNDPATAGTQLFAQAFPLLPGANAAGILATNAIEAVVGL